MTIAHVPHPNVSRPTVEPSRATPRLPACMPARLSEAASRFAQRSPPQ